MIAGDFACTISAEATAPDLFDFCVRRPAVRFDEALFTVYSTVGSPLGSYRLQDCLITSFRFHDAGGASGLAAGLASLTLDWRHVDVSWGGQPGRTRSRRASSPLRAEAPAPAARCGDDRPARLGSRAVQLHTGRTRATARPGCVRRRARRRPDSRAAGRCREADGALIRLFFLGVAVAERGARRGARTAAARCPGRHGSRVAGWRPRRAGAPARPVRGPRARRRPSAGIHEDPDDLVQPVTHSSTDCIDFTVRGQVERALDLGTGSGIQALVARSHAAEVVATDVNGRALDLARFNARLNGRDGIEFRGGSLFEPVAGEDVRPDRLQCAVRDLPGDAACLSRRPDGRRRIERAGRPRGARASRGRRLRDDHGELDRAGGRRVRRPCGRLGERLRLRRLGAGQADARSTRLRGDLEFPARSRPGRIRRRDRRLAWTTSSVSEPRESPRAP